MDRMNNSQQKKYIIIASLAVVILLAITFIPMIFNNNDANQTDPETALETQQEASKPISAITPIDQLDNKAKNLPAERIGLVEKNLFDTIKLNVSDLDEQEIKDARIRDDTFEHTLSNPSKQIYFTTFIVDIPSLKQSYRVNDYYSPLPAQVSGLYDYATLVLCLDKDDLIYGEFDCWDRIRAEKEL